ncbi:MAG: hypothetical protein IJT37_05525 [Lachnospiraceae bacterium]|nr:hypothetical protein [Lachnospiraceae bacterium]
MLVRRGDEKDINAQKVYLTLLSNNRQCWEFYSKDLVEALRALLYDQADDQTYRIVGRYSERRHFVQFDFKEAEPISSEPEAIDSSCDAEQIITV